MMSMRPWRASNERSRNLDSLSAGTTQASAPFSEPLGEARDDAPDEEEHEEEEQRDGADDGGGHGIEGHRDDSAGTVQSRFGGDVENRPRRRCLNTPGNPNRPICDGRWGVSRTGGYAMD